MSRHTGPEFIARPELAALPLMQFIPASSPQYEEPWHLEPLIRELEIAPKSDARVVVAVPVRHAKTATVCHAIAWHLARDPRLEFIFATYSLAYSQRNSRIARNLSKQAGVILSDDHMRLDEWRTSAGGGCIFTSVEGAATGYGCDVLIVDDPFKNREEAESLEIRDKRWDWYCDVAINRVNPRGSKFIIASRWHIDDMSGRALNQTDPKYKHIHLKAIDDAGRALWPNRRPIEYLTALRKEQGEYGFASLCQGEPMPRSAGLFKTATRGPSPSNGIKVAIGLDLAYSAGARSDYSALVVLARVGRMYYVLDVQRRQQVLTQVESMVRFAATAFPGAMLASYVSGPEKGPLVLLAQRGLPIQALPAKWSKYVRAQKCAAAWNEGRIVVPTAAPWLADFVREIESFTGGPGDMNDDQVDALVSAFDVLDYAELSTPDGGFSVGRRAM